MSNIVDKNEVQSSLQRAALLSTRGTKADRSGASGGSPADTAMRLRNEIRIATMNWATVESFNTTYEDFRDALILEQAWQSPLFAVRAVVRDAILTLFRITEDPGQDRQTFCTIIKMFDGKSPAEVAECTGADPAAVAEGLEYLRARVPHRWGSSIGPLDNIELAEVRERFKPIRDSLLAHARVYSSLDLRRDVPATRGFLRLTSMLSDATCMICGVPRDDLDARWVAALEEANRFWRIVAAGSRAAPSV